MISCRTTAYPPKSILVLTINRLTALPIFPPNIVPSSNHSSHLPSAFKTVFKVKSSPNVSRNTPDKHISFLAFFMQIAPF